MKKVVLFFCCVLSMLSFSQTTNVWLSWDANTETNLAGYNVYWGTNSRSYQWTNFVGLVTTNSVTGLSLGRTYYFSVTAKNTVGLESGFSSEPFITIPVINYPPVANSQYLEIYNGNSLAITLSGQDPNGDALTYQIVKYPDKGTIIGTGKNLTYTPLQNLFGYDSLFFNVRDQQVNSADAEIQILILSSNLSIIHQNWSIETNISFGVIGGTNYYTNVIKKLDSFLLSWDPRNGTLQYSTDLSTTNWLNMNSTNNPYIVDVDLYSQCFFRLKKQITVPPVVTNNYSFGNTNEGSLLDTIFDVIPYINASRYLCSSNVSVSQIFAKTPADNGKYKFAIYSDLNGSPRNLLAQSVEITNPTNGWNSANLTFPINITNNVYYWLAIWSDSPSGRIYYSNNGAPLKWYGIGYGSWPNPINTTGTGNASYCIYAK